MNYSIRQTVGDTTVEISGENPSDTFHLYLMVAEHNKETQPEGGMTDAVARQLMDALDTIGEAIKGMGGDE